MRRLFWAAMGVALISMVFAGCKKETTYTVRVTATEGGTVEGQNGEYKEYKKGEYFVLTAVPADGYYFNKWSDGKYYNPRTITIDTSDVNICAEFVDATLPIVDLGLSSGTLWATCNLGAENPWEYGDYYAWGETETKDDFSWETYKYCKGTRYTLTKYCDQAIYGYNDFTDTLTTLLPEDDAATAVLGTDYSMPTEADWKELIRQSYSVWTENYNNQNVSGYIIYKAKSIVEKGETATNFETPPTYYSLKDAHIFLPAAGYRDSLNLYSAGSNGAYWSASYAGSYEAITKVLGDDLWPSDRYCGQSIRPVCRPKP